MEGNSGWIYFVKKVLTNRSLLLLFAFVYKDLKNYVHVISNKSLSVGFWFGGVVVVAVVVVVVAVVVVVVLVLFVLFCFLTKN